MDTVLVEDYFNWLRAEAFNAHEPRRTYEGVLRELHDIPFYWTLVSDDNRVGDALAFRQHEFLAFYEGTEDMDQLILGQWATAAPSVLEVMMGIARRWSFYFDGEASPYFQHQFNNMHFNHYPGRVLSTDSRNDVRHRADVWMSRNFNPDGVGSPFPLNHMMFSQPIPDQRGVDIWGQMNAYSALHFQ